MIPTKKHRSFARLLVAALSAQIAVVSVTAQSVAPAAEDPKVLAKYDKNNDGKLDTAELATKQADDAKAAQAVTTAPAAPGAETPVTMSPFEVSAGEDKGYAASNTLAGTRLNSRIEDIAGSVSVVTKQQLLDTAAIDINDIFLYEVGTEGTGQFTDLTTDGRGDYDNVAGNPTGANRVRGLSAANISVDGFSASSSIPIDTYNVAAVEIARGANSSLAGVGEAGGTVNLVQNRANLSRETTSLTARIDDNEGFRFTLDLNRPIIRNKLSLRFSAAYEEKGYVRKPSVDRTDRQTIGLTFKPFPKTTLSGSFERFGEWARRANSVTPRDTITPWRANGSPTWDWTTRTFTVNGVRSAPVTAFSAAGRPAGIVDLGSSGVRVLQYVDDGKVQFMMNGNNGGLQVFTKSNDLAAGGGLNKVIGTTNKSIYDWTEINLGAPNYEIQDAEVTNFRLEQGIIDTRRFRLNGELAWRKEDQEIYQRSFVAQLDGVGSSLSVDTNEFLNDGRRNPFVGRPFIGGVNPQIFKKNSYSDNFRLQLAGSLDLTRETNLFKWLGRHSAVGYGEYRNNIRAPSLRLHDTIGAHPYFNPATTTNAQGVVTQRALNANNGALTYPLFYYGKTKGGGVEYGNTGPDMPTGRFPASYPTAAAPAGGTSTYVVDELVELREAFFSTQTVQKKINRTMGGTIQSFFLKDSIVSTFGKRKDRVYTIDTLGAAPAIDGYTDDSTVYNFGRNKRWRMGNTDTKGVVVRPFKELPFVKRSADSTGLTRFFGQTFQGLGFHYNDSQNFSPADAALNLYLEDLPNPSGLSKEYGFSLNLFDRKLGIRVTKQETIQDKTRSGIGVVATRALSIDFDNSGQNQNFDLFSALRTWYIGTTATPGVRPDFTEEQFRAKAAEVMGYSREYLERVTAGNLTIADASDTLSKGTEVEVQFNPSRFWTVRMTGGQQTAIETGVSVFIQQFVAEREPIWRSIRVPTDLRADGTQLPQAGIPWFTTATVGSVPESYYLGNVQQPLNIAIANQGKVKTQGREYTANTTTRYQLAGLFPDHKWLRNVSVGGSYRYASQAIIGYLGAAPDPDGVVRKLDRDKPVYDKATHNADLLFIYNTRLFNGKIRTNFQLNVRNVTESGRLQGVGINPDGRVWQYRIIDPRQFIFTTTFDL